MSQAEKTYPGQCLKEWKGSREFRERMGQVLRHVEKFEPTELEPVATAQAGATTMQAAAGAA